MVDFRLEVYALNSIGDCVPATLKQYARGQSGTANDYAKSLAGKGWKRVVVKYIVNS